MKKYKFITYCNWGTIPGSAEAGVIGVIGVIGPPGVFGNTLPPGVIAWLILLGPAISDVLKKIYEKVSVF